MVEESSRWGQRASDPARGALAQLVRTNAPLLAFCAAGEIVREGGFYPGDDIGLPFAVAGLALVTPGALPVVRRHWRIVAAAAVLLGWWVGSDVAHHGGVAGVRLPATLIALCAGALAVRLLPASVAALLRRCVVGFGVVVAGLGLVSLATGGSWWVFTDERSVRLAGPFAYPSAAGLFFILCLVGTLGSAGGMALRAVQALLVVATLATDSRGSLLALAAVVLVARREQRQALLPALICGVLAAPLVLLGQHRTSGHTTHEWLIALGVLLAIVLATKITGPPRAGMVTGPPPAAWGRPVVTVAVVGCGGVAALLLATQHHAVDGFDASWNQRWDTLHSAWSALLRHPWWGAGPDPIFPARTASGAAGIAYFTHNEPLEIALSLGVAGLLVATVLVAASVRRFGLWRERSWRLVLVAFLVAGLVDFVWHFPVLGLVAACVAPAVGRAADEPPRRRRDSAAAGE
jgi:O-Antigen ligase